ncbi:helix-turn-helix transcriptional regulator [Streptomyces sp. NPDC092307]|uniref:helix-turn-helix transcriptional regulator n=1 Tax=Streptomyces sp. NPDC092307 TaxID=3366013 RepID=UPI0037FC4589
MNSRDVRSAVFVSAARRPQVYAAGREAVVNVGLVEVPGSRTSLVVRDPEVASELIAEHYARPRIRIRSGRPFAMAVDAVAAGGLMVDRFHLPTCVRVVLPELRRTVFGTVRRGCCSITGRREELRVPKGDVFACPAGQAVYDMDDMDVEALSLPTEAIQRRAAATGHSEVRFVTMGALDTAAVHQWSKASDFVRRQLLHTARPLSNPLLHASTIDLLATLALSVFPNTTMTADHLPGPGYAGPATLRRAVAFIDAHAARPITLADIADAAGVTPRALQYAFHRTHGISPLAHLRRVRLEHARAELVAADPADGVTVTAVAARWGWAKPGNFSVAYRQAFDVSPSRTLRG